MVFCRGECRIRYCVCWVYFLLMVAWELVLEKYRGVNWALFLPLLVWAYTSGWGDFVAG